MRLKHIYIPLWFYLYIHWWCDGWTCNAFTFHYGSTYTDSSEDKGKSIYLHLYSTMVLLILRHAKRASRSWSIYIPLWFYLYPIMKKMAVSATSFTFHYGSTYTFFCLKHKKCAVWFTFHYGSTYTSHETGIPYGKSYLHSTMVLLIRKCRSSLINL